MGVLKTVATFGLVGTRSDTPVGVSLNIVRGSVLDFHPTSTSTITNNTTNSIVVGAIVNAANEGCLGGGGVDGAINNAGGEELWNDREALPFIAGSKSIRCRTGGAVVTGPAPNQASYGTLHVPFVVHAVGPNYRHFTEDDSDSEDNGNEQQQQYQLPDQLLRSAYQESLARCGEKGITDVAFSLLSAGVFRGTRTVEEVLTIGILAIRDWISSSNSNNTSNKGTIEIETETEAVPGNETEIETEKKEASATTATSVEMGAGGEITPVLPSKSKSKTKQQQKQPNQHQLKSITLCGFNEKEVNLLVKVCRTVFRTNDKSNGENEDGVSSSSSVNAKRPRSP